MKEQLYKRLASYSALASAGLIAASNSTAQIIYTNPPDIHLTGIGAHQELDLNNDGVFDVNVTIDFSAYSNYHNKIANRITSFDSTGNPVEGLMYGDCKSYDGYGFGLLPLKSGKIISPQLNNYYQLWYGIYAGEVLNWGSNGGACHRWAGLKKHFVGFRIFSIPNDFNYGWMRLSVNYSGTKMIIYDWAVNSEINQPINAGQTMKLSDENLQSSNDLQIYSYGKEIFINKNVGNLPLEISVYNLLGQEVKRLNSSDENVKILCNEFQSGIYIVKAKSTDKTQSKEVVIE